MYKNADDKAHADNCTNRDLHIGTCKGIRQVINLERVIGEK